MEWTQENILEFIDMYRDNPCLWDPQNPDYKNISVKNDAWTSIGSIVGCGTVEAKKKMESLMASFRRERQKSQVGGKEEKYSGKWYAYKSMLFLLDKYKAKEAELDAPKFLQTSVECCTQNLSWNTQGESNSQSNKRKAESDPRIQATFSTLEASTSDCNSKSNGRDSSDIFGEYVATKHRKYSDHVKSVMEHLISNILFEADMGKYDAPKQEITYDP